MQEYTGDTLPDLARLLPLGLTDELDPREIEDLKRELIEFCSSIGLKLEFDLTEIIKQAGLARQLCEMFSEIIDEPLASTQEKVLFIDYLHIASLLLTSGKEALIRKFEVQFGLNPKSYTL